MFITINVCLPPFSFMTSLYHFWSCGCCCGDLWCIRSLFHPVTFTVLACCIYLCYVTTACSTRINCSQKNNDKLVRILDNNHSRCSHNWWTTRVLWNERKQVIRLHFIPVDGLTASIINLWIYFIDVNTFILGGKCSCKTSNSFQVRILMGLKNVQKQGMRWKNAWRLPNICKKYTADVK